MTNLEKYRRDAQMSQESVAARIGITQQAVAKWEAGEALPRAERLTQLAKLYGCTVDELLGDGGIRKDEK